MRPVAAQHALDPGLQPRQFGRAEIGHAHGARLPVEQQPAADDRRVLGAIDIGPVVGVELREVVKAISGAGVGCAHPGSRMRERVSEVRQVQTAVVAQQVGVAEHRGGVRVDLDRPVDLVQAQRRVGVEPTVRGAGDAVADRRHLNVGEPERRAGVIGLSEPANHGGVDHDVLVLIVLDAGAPPARMRLVALERGPRLRARAARGGFHPRGRCAEPAGQRPGACVLARRAGMRGQRRGGVRVQEVGVVRGAADAARRHVHAAVRLPGRLQQRLHPVGERPVPVVRPPLDRRGGERARLEQVQRCGGDAGAPQKGPSSDHRGLTWGGAVSLLAAAPLRIGV